LNYSRLALALLFLFFIGCAQVDPNNPFDPETPADQQARGRVSGRLVAPEGFDLARLPEVKVTLRDLETAGDGVSAQPDLEGGDAGTFVFDALRPTTYLLSVSVTGLSFEPVTLPVAPGAVLELGDLRLRAPDAASARRGLLTGRVLRRGAADDGHAGISVRVDGAPYFALTDAVGAFVLEAPEGLQSLAAQSAGYSPLSLGEVRFSAATPTHLPEAFVLVPKPGRVRGQLRVDRFGAPALLERLQARLLDASQNAAGVLSLGSDGAFEVADVSPGTYTLEARLTGYGPIARRVDVAAEQVADVGELLLQHISGGAEAKSLRGRVTLPGADDAAGVTVVARFADRAEVRLAETLTDLEGAFTIAAAPDEAYVLDLRKPGYETLSSIGPFAWSVERAAFVDAAGDAPDAVLMPEPGEVRVEVRFADPTLATDAARFARIAVMLERTDAQQPPVTFAPVARALPDGGAGGAPLFVGDARFDGVPPGRYRVVGSLEGGGFSSPTALARVGAGEVVSAELTLTQFQGADVVAGVTGRARLQGRADDISHGRILVYAQGLPLTQITAPDGSYALTGLLPGEPVTLGFQRDGYGVATLQVPPLGLGETRRLDDVILSANPGEVRGTITLNQFSTEDAVRDASVVLLSPEGAPVGAQGQREGGAFAIVGVPAGEYRLRASAVGYEAVERAVRVIEGEARTENVALNHESLTAARVLMTGRVTLESARDFAGTAVRVRIAGREVPFAAAATDRDGTFALFASPSESYRLDLEQAGWQPAVNIGPYRWDTARATFVDDAGRALERVLGSEPFEGRVTVGLQFTDSWVQAGGYADRADVRLVGRDSREVRAGVAAVATPAEFTSLPPDVYDVSVERRGFDPFTATVAVTRAVPSPDAVVAALRLRRLADAGFSFSGQRLRAADLCGLDLTFTDFAGAQLCGDFSRGALTCAPVDPTPFSFQSGRLSGASLGARSAGAPACGGASTFRGVDFAFSTLFSANLTGADAIDANFNAANLTNASLRDAVLSDATRARPENVPYPCEGDQAQRRGTPALGGHAETGGDGAVVDDGLRTDLRGAVLAGADLTGATLSGLDLRETEFGGVLLVGAQLETTCLRDTRLALTDLSRANLQGADARGIVLANSVMQQTDLRGADLRDASLLSAVLDRTMLGCRAVEADDLVTPEDESGLCRCPDEPLDALDAPGYEDRPRDAASRGCRTRLNRAALNGANFVGADFSGADLTDTGLTGIEIGNAQAVDAAGARVVTPTRFQETRFDGANLTGVAWNNANLTRATLRNANLSNAAFFENSTYENIVLTGADLSNTNLSGLDLRGWDLQNTLLLETDLRAADARYVSFDGATLVSPLIDGARLRGASFERVDVIGTFDVRRSEERQGTLGEPALDPLGPEASLEGFSFRGAHFISGDLSWMSTVAGLNLDGAAFGRCHYPGEASVDARPLVAGPGFRFIAATLRGAHARRPRADLRAYPGPSPSAGSPEPATCPVEWWRILNVLDFAPPGADLTIEKSDISGADFNAPRLILQDTLAEGAQLRGVEALTARRAQLTGAHIDGGNRKAVLDIELTDLSNAEFSGQHLSGAIARSTLRGAELNASGGSVAQWRGMEFRMVDFTDTPLPRDFRVFYDRPFALWDDRAMIVDSFVPSGTTVDVSDWKGVELVRTDLRGVTLRVSGDPAEQPETTTSRVITVANCPIRGLTVSTPANGAVPTVLDLESVDVRPLAAGAIALRNPNDLVTFWRVRGGDLLDAAPLDDVLSALPAAQRRAVAGPLLKPFADFGDRAEYDNRVRGLCAADPTGNTCYIPLPPERSGAFPVLTGANLATLAGLDPGAWEGAQLSESTLGVAAGGPVALRLEAGSASVSGNSAGMWQLVEGVAERTGLSFAASTLRNVAVSVQRAAGGEQVFSGINLVGATLGAGFSWADNVPPSGMTLARATVDPTAVLRGCERCSASGAQSGAGAEVAASGLLGLLATSAHLDMSRADLAARLGEPVVVEPAEGVSFAGARLDGRVVFGPSASAAPVALWGASLDGGIIGGHVLLSGATGDGVTLRNSLEGAVFGRHALTALSLERSARLPLGVLWDAVDLHEATLALGPSDVWTAQPGLDKESGVPPDRWFSLRRADLRGLNNTSSGLYIVGADMRCADFRDYRPVDGVSLAIRHSNLDFADFRGADLSQVAFTDVSARYVWVDEATVLPAFDANGAPRRNDLSFARGDSDAGVQRTRFVQAFQASDSLKNGHANTVTGRFDRPDRVPFPDCAQSL